MIQSAGLALIVGLFLVSGWQAIGNIPSEVRTKATELGHNFLHQQIASQKKGVGEFLWMRIEEYDLTREARKTLDALADEERFVKFLEGKGVDFDKAPSKNDLPFVIEYLQNSTNLSPAIAGWFSLIFDFEAPWERAFPAYRKVAVERPNDFLPKVTTLFHRVRTSEQADEWLTLFKEAYQTAPASKERTLCVILLPSHTFHVAGIPESGKQLEDLSNWLDQLAKTETIERLPALADISLIKFLVAFARKDYSQAATLAQGARLRSLGPLMLLMAEKNDDARKVLEELSGDLTLSDQEKKLLQTIRAILEELDAAATPKPHL